ncbi:MAG: efflux RND transporter periplasmic adaptor subunit [Chloroflexi bacterium]|nr:MAG: efflux RND transporter periplasmic adaptor subunit [Chloroflexota bacterium]
MSRRIWIGLIIVLALIAGIFGYTRLRTSSAPPEEEAPPVEEAEPVVWASGKLLPARRAALSFAIGGRVAEIAVEEGDEVEAGHVLARLDAAALEEAVAQAEAALAVAQAQLAQVKAGARPEEIATARQAVAAAKANLAATEAQLNAAKADVERAQAELDRALAAQAKLLAGPTQYELNLANIAIDTAKDQLYGAQAQRDAIGGAVQRGVASQAEYEAAKAAVLQAEDAVRSAQVEYERLKAGPSAQDKAMAAAAVSAAQAAKAAADAQVAALQAQVDAAKAAVAQAEQRLHALEAGPTPEQVAVAEAQVQQAEAALEAARANLEQATLRAPFAGTIGAVSVHVGEVIAPGQSVVTLGDVSHLRVETTDLRETDVARVAEGQPVEVTFDSLPDVRLPGKVARIAPMATQGQGGTNYTVWVECEELDPRLRWGMTAYVNIQVGQ